ncbi:hypothetical protein EDD76_12231 [Kineothrix alysoides]|uniref:Uncharacterized protein n=1 Tax=Kineothrix alysoides TaxID=1469948 RepID=A0A4R1QTC8_9FIRM|nr:hypothetical protein [Kineothrix alysoides]TCL54114.1 hypothetical protein EDD76_12231 [Kineothrix alysoides]
MKLIELQGSVDQNGELAIPRTLLRDMGLRPGAIVILPDGRYTSGVLLCNEQEAVDYIEMQKDYQHRVMVCNSDDFCVFEMVEGQLIHPSPEVLEQLRGERREQSGGMEMKL